MSDENTIEDALNSPVKGQRIIIAGGGTGGHIFPAIAIANALKVEIPGIEILFVGAKGKMEMEKVPQAGYRIEGIDIAGFNRSSLIKNIGLPFKLVKSFMQVRSILNFYKPSAVIGVGGYSSFPVLKSAQGKGIPTFIHESNSFAGKSNMMLGKNATKIFVASDGMEKFFPKDKLIITGNPVRKTIAEANISKEEALQLFGLASGKTTVLAVGGSLGARSINEALASHLDEISSNNLQLIWQTGKTTAQEYMAKAKGYENVFINDFITQMERAYAAADIVISRAGAMAVTELCVTEKPVVFVPFPFAAEDHQTVNAKHLVDKNAALMIKDNEAKEKLVSTVIALAKDEEQQRTLKTNIAKLAVKNADEVIAKEIARALKGKGNEYMIDERNIRQIGGTPLGIGRLYFIGIGGIGMSGLARYYHSKGVEVSGYDRTRTPLTEELEAAGIRIHYQENVDLIPKEVDFVVYTPAVPAEHAELVFYRKNDYNVLKRSDVLKLITESSFNICVGGTHGKTTTSTMIAHILRHTGFGCNAFLGGISANYGTNFWSSEKNVCVVEADEYDRSFLKLSPDVAVITAIDADHLDIYGTAEEVENAFVQFTKRVKPGGVLVSKHGLARANEMSASVHKTYSFDNSKADVYAANIVVENGSYVFDVMAKDWIINNTLLHMGGLHNIENVVAAIAVAKQLGIDDQKIKNAVAAFKGVKRRFEYVIQNENQVLIDDYAHHPEELKALIKGVKSLFKQRLVLIFQPHLYTRTQDLAEGFAESLDLADEVILLPIYPARELPIEGVESELILKKMAITNKQVLSKEEVKSWVKANRPALLVMAGAGDIDAMVEPVKSILENS